MIKRIVLLLSLLLLLFTACKGKKNEVEIRLEKQKENITNILSENLGRCTRKDSINFYVGERLLDYMNSAAKVYMTYGFQVCGTAKYALPDTNFTMFVDVYNMSSPENAFGIYSYNRYNDAKIEPTIGGEAFFSDYSVDFYDADYYIHVQLFQTGKELIREMSRVARVIDGKIVKESVKPSILTKLPAENKVPNSETYLHEKLALDAMIELPGNLFRLNSKTEVAIADYTDEKDELYKLFYISYPEDISVNSPFNNFKDFVMQDTTYTVVGEPTSNSLMIARDEAYHFLKIEGKYLTGGWNIKDQEFVTAIMK